MEQQREGLLFTAQKPGALEVYTGWLLQYDRGHKLVDTVSSVTVIIKNARHVLFWTPDSIHQHPHSLLPRHHHDMTIISIMASMISVIIISSIYNSSNSSIILYIMVMVIVIIIATTLILLFFLQLLTLLMWSRSGCSWTAN